MDFKWILVRLGGLLGTSWGVLGRLGGVLGASWRVLGASWAHLGASWERLGTSWPPSSLQDRKKLEKPTKNHQFINPPAVRPDAIPHDPPPDLPLPTELSCGANVETTSRARSRSQRRFPSSASRRLEWNRAPLPLQTSPYLKIFILRSHPRPQRPAPR